MNGNSIRTIAHPTSSIRAVAPWCAVIFVALVAGAFAAGQAEAAVGAKPALLLLGALVASAFVGIFLYLGPTALLIWPVAATGGYLLQIPRHNVVLTFDRLWIGGLLAYIATTPRRIPRTPETRLLRFGLLWLVASFGLRALTTSLSITGPFRTWVDAIVLPAILFVACERYCLRGSDRTRRLAASLMVAGGVLAAIGIAERVLGFELATLTGGSVRYDTHINTTRISGPYPVPETYALSLAICFAATLYWLLSRRRGRGYGWAVLLAVLQAVAIGLAFFRAGWIAAILVVIASLGFRPGRFGRAFALTGVTLAVAFATSLQLQESNTVANRLNNSGNVYARLATYKQGIAIFRSAPFFGVGVDRYKTVAQTRSNEYVKGVPSVNSPHSSFVGLLGEQGVFGFLPLLVLSFAVWRLILGLRGVSYLSREATLLLGTVSGAVLAYLIMSLTLTMLPYEASNTFFAAFLGVASGRLDALTQEARATTS